MLQVGIYHRSSGDIPAGFAYVVMVRVWYHFELVGPGLWELASEDAVVGMEGDI